MNRYRYTAKEASGEVIESFVEAASRYEALATLHARQVTVISLDDAEPDARGAKKATRGTFAKGPHLRGARISLAERAVFCRQLSISVSSGVPLRESLENISLDMDNPVFRRILRQVVAHLDDGKMLSQSISGLETVFSRLFVAMVRAAEESGTMAPTLDYLAESMEKADRLARKIRSITAYPVFIAVFFCIVSIIMTIFVLPQFQKVFTSFHSDLPMLTRGVFAFNTFLLGHVLIIGLIVTVLAILLTLWVRSRPGRAQFDHFILHVPFFGPCVRKLAVARFCRNFAMLLRGGVPVASAMEITSETLNNKAMEASLLASRQRIIAGSAISTSLDREVFPRVLIRMVNVGETSGRLPEVLERVSNVYEDQVEGSILTATALFEPVVICIFGAMILTLVLAIYMPVFTVASHVR